MKKDKETQITNSILLLNLGAIKLLYQIALKVSECLLLWQVRKKPTGPGPVLMPHCE